MGKQEMAWITEARGCHRAGKLDEAAMLYRRILGSDPDHVEALLGLADVLEARGEGGPLLRLLEGAVERSGKLAPLHERLGDARHAQGDLAGAIPCYVRSLELEPGRGGALWGLGCARAALGDHAAAIDVFGKLVAIQPGNGLARHNLGRSLFELGRVDDALRAFGDAVDLLPPDMRCMPLGNIAVAIPGSTSASNEEILQARRSWTSRCLPSPPTRKSPPTCDRGAPPLVRLGYVSSFFDKRNWMKPVWGLINRHDRDRFEIHLFSDAPESAVGPGLRRDPRDHFHDVSSMGNQALADLIARLGIDLLVDLNGYSKPGRLPLFGLRPAPVQAAWFNMFATSGFHGMDYLIGDDHVIPVAEEPFYSETIVRVPGSYLTFEVAYPVPDVSPAPCLERGTLTLGCLAPQYKITPEVVEAWSRILRETPGTRLFLKNTVLEHPAGRDLVVGHFQRHAVPADRLILEGPADHFTFLGRYAAIDLALDSFPYNGGTTTMEALWQGVPVLTFHGDRWASRISASLLREAGLADFVAPDPESFVDRAIHLVTDPATPGRLGELRRTMRERLKSSSVCRVDSFTRSLEQVYLRMVQAEDRP